MDLTSILQPVIDAITAAGKPILILGLLLWAVARWARPILPEWANNFQNYIQGAIVAAVVFGLATTLADFFLSLGGA